MIREIEFTAPILMRVIQEHHGREFAPYHRLPIVLGSGKLYRSHPIVVGSEADSKRISIYHNWRIHATASDPVVMFDRRNDEALKVA